MSDIPANANEPNEPSRDELPDHEVESRASDLARRVMNTPPKPRTKPKAEPNPDSDPVLQRTLSTRKSVARDKVKAERKRAD